MSRVKLTIQLIKKDIRFFQIVEKTIIVSCGDIRKRSRILNIVVLANAIIA